MSLWNTLWNKVGLGTPTPAPTPERQRELERQKKEKRGRLPANPYIIYSQWWHCATMKKDGGNIYKRNKAIGKLWKDLPFYHPDKVICYTTYRINRATYSVIKALGLQPPSKADKWNKWKKAGKRWERVRQKKMALAAREALDNLFATQDMRPTMKTNVAAKTSSEQENFSASTPNQPSNQPGP